MVDDCVAVGSSNSAQLSNDEVEELPCAEGFFAKVTARTRDKAACPADTLSRVPYGDSGDLLCLSQGGTGLIAKPGDCVTTPFNFAVCGPGGAALRELGSCLPESKMWRCAGVKNSRPNGSVAHAAFPDSAAGSKHNTQSDRLMIYLLWVQWSASSIRIAHSGLPGGAPERRQARPDPASSPSA